MVRLAVARNRRGARSVRCSRVGHAQRMPKIQPTFHPSPWCAPAPPRPLPPPATPPSTTPRAFQFTAAMRAVGRPCFARALRSTRDRGAAHRAVPRPGARPERASDSFRYWRSTAVHACGYLRRRFSKQKLIMACPTRAARQPRPGPGSQRPNSPPAQDETYDVIVCGTGLKVRRPRRGDARSRFAGVHSVGPAVRVGQEGAAPGPQRLLRRGERVHLAAGQAVREVRASGQGARELWPRPRLERRSDPQVHHGGRCAARGSGAECDGPQGSS